MHHIVSFVSHSTVLQIWQLNGPHVPFQTMPCPKSFTSVDRRARKQKCFVRCQPDMQPPVWLTSHAVR